METSHPTDFTSAMRISADPTAHDWAARAEAIEILRSELNRTKITATAASARKAIARLRDAR